MGILLDNYWQVFVDLGISFSCDQMKFALLCAIIDFNFGLKRKIKSKENLSWV